MNIRKLAAIDIGSNAIRLLINYVYEFPKSDPVFNKTALVRMPVRLGKDVFTEKRISDRSASRMIAAMKAFRLMMDIYGVEEYLAFATSAMRESENGKEILKKIKKKANIKVKIIDGETEARLIFASELNRFVIDGNNYLYVDVGGGSTELTLIKNNRVGISKSFEIGTVRLMEGRVDNSIYPEMKKWIEENIRKYQVDLIGSGGNINHVYKYSGVKLGKPLPGSYVRKNFKIIREMSFEERLREFNMKPDRADVIEYALEIYVKVMKWTRAKKIHVPKIGISDGMIRSLYQELKEKG
ncbi:MAG: exopolyphosphatase [Weeksellaceae bacterium]